MANDWIDETEGEEITDKQKTVRVSEEESSDMELIIRFQNEASLIRGKKRKKWKDQTVLRKALQAYVDAFWDFVCEGRPELAEDRQRAVEEKLEALRKEHAEKSKKKKGG